MRIGSLNFEKTVVVGVIAVAILALVLGIFAVSLQPRISGYFIKTTDSIEGFILEKVSSYKTDSTEMSTFELTLTDSYGNPVALSKDTILQISITESTFIGDAILIDKYGKESPVMPLGGREKEVLHFTEIIILNIPVDTMKVRITTEVLTLYAKMEVFDILSNVQATYSIGFSTAGTLGGGEKDEPQLQKH